MFKLQKISNFKTEPYITYEDNDTINVVCPDAKYDNHHAELFNPHTGEVYLEAVQTDAYITRFSSDKFYGYYEQKPITQTIDDVTYGAYVNQW